MVRAEGNYPVDCSARDERFFRDEDAARRAVHCLAEGSLTNLAAFDPGKTCPCEQ